MIRWLDHSRDRDLYVNVEDVHRKREIMDAERRAAADQASKVVRVSGKVWSWREMRWVERRRQA